jgi:hypothetical protein
MGIGAYGGGGECFANRGQLAGDQLGLGGGIGQLLAGGGGGGCSSGHG